MSKLEFLELFSEKDAYGYMYLSLDEAGFCIIFIVSSDEFFINYQEDFEDYDGYYINRADANLEINFDIAMRIYKFRGINYE